MVHGLVGVLIVFGLYMIFQMFYGYSKWIDMKGNVVEVGNKARKILIDECFSDYPVIT